MQVTRLITASRRFSTTLVCFKNSIVQSHSSLSKSIISVSPKRSLCSSSKAFSSTSASTTPSATESVSIKAYYIAQRINLAHVHANVYGRQKKSRQEQKSVTFEIDKAANQYVTVFKYGSIVLFNVPELQHQVHLTNIRQSAVVTPISSSGSSSTPSGVAASTADVAPLTEDYKIIVNPSLDRPSVVKAEHVNIRSLNSNNIAIISTVMAQSVALDYYAGTYSYSFVV